jgi:uncharacterized 2Fe-2S/4Fe-4S cluster protein (DUF4445 family)
MISPDNSNCSVTFEPIGRTIDLVKGTRLVEAVAEIGLAIHQPCGGEGTCGKCRVRIVQGANQPTPVEQNLFTEGELADGWRLACQAIINEDSIVHLPESSLLGSQPLDTVDIREKSTPAEKIYKGAPVLAVDLGTTSVAAILIGPGNGHRQAIANGCNLQSAYGDDLISRILYARDNPNGLFVLHRAAVESINKLIDKLAQETGIDQSTICRMTVSGNTVMQHLLANLDLSPLGQIPFEPVTTEMLTLKADQLGLNIAPQGDVLITPSIGGFVGGDTVSGLMVIEQEELEDRSLFIDIGTNGELAIWHNGRWTATSTAAGPAFEGARISCGMRATGGAIKKCSFDGSDLRFELTAKLRPRGICGSALIDLMAELHRLEVLRSDGLLLSGDRLPDTVPEPIRRRMVVEKNGQPAIELFDAASTESGRPIRVTQKDIREFQLAKGAIRAGIKLLLRRAGLKSVELNKIYMAGAFGNFIRRENAQQIGLLPTDVDQNKIVFEGNTSLAGARSIALDRAAQANAERIARETCLIDLSAEPDFAAVFADSMNF